MAARRRNLSRTLRFYLHRLFPRHEDSHSVATSVALGIWIAVLPTLGVALALTVLAAHLARVPKGPGLVASFVATPPTLFLFFYPLAYFKVGLPLVKPPPASFDFLHEVQKLSLANAGDLSTRLWRDAQGHVIAFLVGVFVVATVSAALGYALSFAIMQRKLARRHSARAARRALRQTEPGPVER
jgi:uncharacterized protein (DUF2062 family)